jgi:outer membrane protein OmpA-like peptidoglycan-associated protein
MSDVASAVKSNPIYALLFLFLAFASGLLLAFLRGPQAPPTGSATTETLATVAPASVATPSSSSEESRDQVDLRALDARLSDARTRIQGLEQSHAAMAEEQKALHLAVSEQRDRLTEVLAEMNAAAEPDRDAEASARPPIRLADDLARLGARPAERGHLVTLTESELRFPVGESALPSDPSEGLQAIAEVLLRHDRLLARVEGHTDRSGSASKNLALSRERARAVKDALAAMGVDAARIEIAGLGETRTIDDGRTAEARQRNRRVEVYLIER